MTIRVVFHIDENAKWELLLNNIRNMIREVNVDSSFIEVVANSEAVKFYRKAENPNGLETAMKLADEGVRFAACRNALNGLRITQEELYPFVHTVPSGVVELAIRQQEGCAYIKP